MKERLDSLEQDAKQSGFKVERDDSMMVIKRSGFSYMFAVNQSDEMMSEMIQDAREFMRDVIRIGK